MPEPLEERLSRLTPDGSGLDRDALLFAAGRASARPPRGWQALACVLAASQLLTLALLWPRTPEAPAGLPVADSKPPTAPPPPPAPARGTSELWALRQAALGGNDLPPPPAPAGLLVSDRPPLRAFGAPPPELLH